MSSGRVILSPALRRALAQHFPGFRQIGDCAPGDFDGNGLEDVALYLTNRRRGLPFHQSTWLFIGFLQTTSGTFHSYLIARRRDPSTVYDREEHRPRRFDDYGGFTVGMGTFTIATQGRRARQVRFENDVIIEPDSGNFRFWFFRAGQWHGAWEVGDDLGE